MKTFRFRREHFGLLNLALTLGAFLNLLAALISGAGFVYRTMPAWFLLLALSLGSSAMANLRVLLWVVVVALCVGMEFLLYKEYNNEILIRTCVNYAPLTMFMLMLLSSRTEERNTAKEQAYARLRVLRSEADDRLKLLRKIRTGELETTSDGQEDVVRNRKTTFDIYQELYPKILKIRFKRDIPPIVQEALHGAFGMEAGVIYELPPEKGGEFQLRARWGVPDEAAATEALARFATSDLVRRTADTRAPMQPDVIKRQPNLYEEYDEFAAALFPLDFLAPVVVLGRTTFVVISGKPGDRGRIPFEFNLLPPILAGCGLAISKLAQKDGRASFSTFGAGT